ncbi:stage II sporulation protein E (SpoIIE) [Chitinophaga silvatica]|uniref:Stage II sporulation protein E (SpoIIE) n=1 Tax=Chitinophaga silvatica TaxID=2282649 RepID=A0A3E1Y3K5_9BACT|nr:protein phosphatase 2C domain-containing protein [Chitinophaga silvatica]RFS19280.1 stage II sporulation protein E (SpoIIE) [Chitinophaga silvatica]
MKLFSHLQIGDHHVNHCEDYFLTAKFTEYHLVTAVMDGCSMGTDSYLPATLTGKLLRKICKEFYYRSFIEKSIPNTNTCLEQIFNQLFKEWTFLSKYLDLSREELLNTLLLAVVDLRDQNLELLCIGDGVVCINGQVTSFEQNNKPDYLGYHLKEKFEDWWNNQPQRITAKKVNDFSVSTDGVFSFSAFDNKSYKPLISAPDFLLIDDFLSGNGNMLYRKLIILEEEYGIRPTDDLGIVRVIF